MEPGVEKCGGVGNSPKWRIELFEGIRAVSGQTAVTHFETRKSAALLAFLAYHPDRMHSRELLAEMLWPDEDPDATRDRLRQALAAIRRALRAEDGSGCGLLLTERSEVGISSEHVDTDAGQFVRMAEEALRLPDDEGKLTKLERAIALCHGELLPGWYEPWITSERERINDLLYQALCSAAQIAPGSSAIAYAKRAVSLDPLREEAAALLMRAYASDRRTADALRQYKELEKALREELGVAPSESTRSVVSEIRNGSLGIQSAAPAPSTASSAAFEPDGGAVPIGSPYYIARPTDAEFYEAVLRRDSIVLVKGARQIGKTSLLARGLQHAREHGTRVILTDLQKLTDEQLASAESLFFTLAESINDQLDLDEPVSEVWKAGRGWNVNFERFMRKHVLLESNPPIIWGLDEIDRLFGYEYSKSVFGLFRAWHNERSLDPSGPWSRLTLAIAYATEAHLFISDLNQSPFNVGTRLALSDFTPGEVSELNRRCGSMLQSDAEIKAFMAIVGGHPYLVRRGIHALAASSETLDQFLGHACREDGVFGDHLLRTYNSLAKDESLCHAMVEVLNSRPCPSPETFYRLQSAGLISGESQLDARPRCRLYADFLARRLL